MDDIGGGDEHDLRQVIFHVQVVVHKAVVLFRVQHFQQGRRGVPAEIHAHLVHFVQQKDRVLGSGFLHHLDDLPRQGSDIGPAMPPDLGLVPDSSQRQPDELASGSPGYGTRQRRFPHSGRTHQAENRTLGVFHQLAHGQELQDTLLDLLQSVVVLVKNLFRPLDLLNFLGPLLPGDRQQPIDVVAGDGGLGRHGRHHFQPLHLLHGFFKGVLGHAGCFDLALELIHLRFLIAAQLLLNGLHLLIQVVLFLGLFHLTLDPRVDGTIHVQLFDLRIQNVLQPVEPVHRIENFQQFLLFLDGDGQIGSHGIGQAIDVLDAHGGHHGVVIQVLAQFHILLEQRGDLVDQCLGIAWRLAGGGRRPQDSLQVLILFQDL